MERILVAMNTEGSSFWAAIHALNLAKRIKAKVFFLLVLDAESKGASDDRMEDSARKRLEPLIENGRSKGLTVEYYLTRGNYEEELISFIQENKVTFLVVGSPGKEEGSRETFTKVLEKIRHRINCRIEVVYEKPLASANYRKGDGNVAPVSTDSGKQR